MGAPGPAAWKVVRIKPEDKGVNQLSRIIAAVNREGFPELNLPPSLVFAVNSDGFLTFEGKEIKDEEWGRIQLSLGVIGYTTNKVKCVFIGIEKKCKSSDGKYLNKDSFRAALVYNALKKKQEEVSHSEKEKGLEVIRVNAREFAGRELEGLRIAVNKELAQEIKLTDGSSLSFNAENTLVTHDKPVLNSKGEMISLHKHNDFLGTLVSYDFRCGSGDRISYDGITSLLGDRVVKNREHSEKFTNRGHTASFTTDPGEGTLCFKGVGLGRN